MGLHDRSLTHGARPAGRFAEADALSRLFVWSLRRWLDGAWGQQDVRRWYAARVGEREAFRALSLFEQHLLAVAEGHRRVLHRHETDCGCIGADEMAMARTVAVAAAGDLSAAYAQAACYVRTEGLFQIVETAAQLGRLLAKIGDAPPAATRAEWRAEGLDPADDDPADEQGSTAAAASAPTLH